MRPIMSCIWSPMSSMPGMAMISTWGPPWALISTSTMRSSSFPSRHMVRNFSRVEPASALATEFSGPGALPSPGGGAMKKPWPSVAARRGGRSTSSSRSSAIFSALTLTRSISSLRTMFTPISIRSRTMDSTSRPT